MYASTKSPLVRLTSPPIPRSVLPSPPRLAVATVFVFNCTLFSSTLALNASAKAPSPPTAAPAPTPPTDSSRGEPSASKPIPDASGLTKPPTLLRFVDAQFSEPRPEFDEPATVLLELTIGEDGRVTDVQVVAGIDATLDDAAVAAAKQFLFAPAEASGRPVAVRIRYEYVYVSPPPEPDTSPPAALDVGAAPAPLPVPSQSAAGESAAAAVVGRLEGTLLESGKRQPIAGAKVRLPRLERETFTDGQGRFVFDDVPVGRVELTLTDATHATVEDTEEVTRGVATDVTYYAEPTGFGEDDLVAVGTRDKKLVTRRELSPRELTTVPGSNGDALNAMQNLPGVARSSSDVIVMRGESNSRVFVNGHLVPLPFHFGGLRSAVGSSLIQSLQVTPGNYDVRYGNTNGGIVDIVTRRPASDGLHGAAHVDVFDAGVFIEGPLTKHATFALGGRRSYVDAVLSAALSDEDKRTFSSAPRYYDAQGTLDWQKGRHRLRVNGFGSDDRLVLMFDEPVETDPAIRGRVNAQASWYMGQALWDFRISEQTQLATGLSYLNHYSKVSAGASLHGYFGSEQVTLRSDVSHEFAPWLTARAGVNVVGQRDEFSAVAGRGTSEGLPPPIVSVQETLYTKSAVALYNPAAYTAWELTLGRLLLIPALRVDHFSAPNQLGGKTLVQPHLDARLRVGDTTTLKGGFGLYSRQVEGYILERGFGNPKLEPELSSQYSAGIEQRLSDHLTFDAVGFYKDLFHQVSYISDPALKFDNEGKGRAYGGEFLLKHDAGTRFYGWIAYTVMRSERRESESPSYRVFDYDQTHNLNVVGQYRITPTWEVGARFRYVTGAPLTPVVGATYDSDADVYSPSRGAVNSDRVDAFHQLDVRVDKHWLFDTWRLTAYLDVQNAYNRTNPQSIAYNFDYTQSKPSPGVNLPLIPSFGVKGEF
jgi:TonB family protein